MWQHPPADPLVITDYVAFGDAVSGKQHLLVAQSQKARVPQFAFGRPFGETNLGYQLGLHPMHSRAGHPVSGEWTHTGLEPREPFSQTAQGNVVVSGSDLAGIPELSALVVADQQGPKTDALALGIGISCNNKFLFVDAFGFQPLAGPLGHIAATAILGNDSFPVPVAGFLVLGFAFGFAEFVQAQRLLKFEGILKELLPVSQRHVPQVVSIQVKEVEGIKSRGHSLPKFSLCWICIRC